MSGFCSTNITQEEKGGQKNTLGRDNTSFCEHGKQTRSLHGGSLLMTVSTQEQKNDKVESTVPSFETKASTKVQPLFIKLMQSLISAGLVKGIIPMSMRRKSNQAILGFATLRQDGNDAEKQKVDCGSWRNPRPDRG